MNETPHIPPIVVSGSIAIDTIMSFGRAYSDIITPDTLNDLSVSVFLDRKENSYGGVGANIAYTLALLGEHPYLLGSVGPDGLLYMERLARIGVGIQHIHESDLPTASFTVITDAEQKQVGGFYPGAMFDSESLSFAPWKQQQPVVVISPHDPAAMERQVAECSTWGLTLMYDVGQQVTNIDGDALKAGVQAADILIVNAFEITTMAGKIGMSVDEIKAMVPIVVTTLGEDGSRIEGKALLGECIEIECVPVTEVADPTGAGDAYRAGFLYGYARRWALRECAQLGAACAAYAVERVGTQKHTFTLEQISKRYTRTFNEPLPITV